jgi:hypothetical protein
LAVQPRIAGTGKPAQFKEGRKNFQPASLCRIAAFHYDCEWGLKGAMQYRNLDRSGQFK